jgi:hypothetical protein
MLNKTNGLTIGCWVNVAGIENRTQRIFDIPWAVGTQGLAVDISGTNQIYSGWNKPSGPIDKLSTAGYNSMVYSGTGTKLQAGAYGLKILLYSAKNNPVIQLRRSTDTNPTDFYASANGTLTTGPNGTGTGIVAWLNSARGYVTKWYDQTGNGHHGTGTYYYYPNYPAQYIDPTADLANYPFTDPSADLTKYPFIDITSYSYYVVDFNLAGYFRIEDNATPTGNLPYTYIFKHGRYLTTRSSCAYCFGKQLNAGNGQFECFIFNFNVDDGTGACIDTWYNNGNESRYPSQSSNSVYAVTYNGINNSGKKLYINNVDTAGNGSGTNTRNQTSNQNVLGTWLGYGATYGGTMPYFYWSPSQLTSSDIAILGF